MFPSPDIVWILTTQWRGQALGVAGDEAAHTPQLDALAAGGVLYRQAVTPHPFGPFARAALLTGRPSPANGVRHYFDPLPPGARTIAHQLAERGYRTAFFGKWHLAPRDAQAPLTGEAHARTRVPREYRGGFEHWEGFESGFLLNDPWWHGDGCEEFVRLAGYQSDVACQRALAWWQTSHRSAEADSPAARTRAPRFVVVSLEAPHPPYHAPAAGIIPPAPNAISLRANVPRGGEVEARARQELSGYYAHLTATDRAIGRLVSSLPPATIVVVTSVHGDMHGAHGLFRKGWPYEESIRVPFIVRDARASNSSTSPGRVARVSDKPVSLIDLPAMTLTWTEGKPWVCPNDRALLSMPSVVALPHQCDRTWHGYRTPTRKVVFNTDGSPWLEFDLANDPYELRNLAATHSSP